MSKLGNYHTFEIQCGIQVRGIRCMAKMIHWFFSDVGNKHLADYCSCIVTPILITKYLCIC